MTSINSPNDIRKSFHLEKVLYFLSFFIIRPSYHGASRMAYNLRQTHRHINKWTALRERNHETDIDERDINCWGQPWRK